MKVSVCLATFNGEKYISDQITSILSQLAPDDEIIISDDGSTDNTLNIIRREIPIVCRGNLNSSRAGTIK